MVQIKESIVWGSDFSINNCYNITKSYHRISNHFQSNRNTFKNDSLHYILSLPTFLKYNISYWLFYIFTRDTFFRFYVKWSGYLQILFSSSVFSKLDTNDSFNLQAMNAGAENWWLQLITPMKYLAYETKAGLFKCWFWYFYFEIKCY